jgi:aldose 1-epimerase
VTRPELLRLGSDELEIELLPEVGGRLHRLRAFGHDLLLTPVDTDAHRKDPVFWGAFVMAPWCNRAAPGPTTLLGARIDLAPNFEDGSAIHGLVFDIPWQVTGDGELDVAREGDARWPWSFGVALSVAVDGATLDLAYRLRNASDSPMPAGLGLHPWFRRPLELRVPAASVYPRNTDSPAEPEPATGPLDLRGGGEPPPDLDGTWTDFDEPVVDLAWPALGLRARLQIETLVPHVAVASPPERGAVAVEPQTHAPDPMRRLASGQPGAPAVLTPSEELVLTLRLTVEPT